MTIQRTEKILDRLSAIHIELGSVYFCHRRTGVGLTKTGQEKLQALNAESKELVKDLADER